MRRFSILLKAPRGARWCDREVDVRLSVYSSISNRSSVLLFPGRLGWVSPTGLRKNGPASGLGGKRKRRGENSIFESRWLIGGQSLLFSGTWWCSGEDDSSRMTVPSDWGRFLCVSVRVRPIGIFISFSGFLVENEDDRSRTVEHRRTVFMPSSIWRTTESLGCMIRTLLGKKDDRCTILNRKKIEKRLGRVGWSCHLSPFSPNLASFRFWDVCHLVSCCCRRKRCGGIRTKNGKSRTTRRHRQVVNEITQTFSQLRQKLVVLVATFIDKALTPKWLDLVTRNG